MRKRLGGVVAIAIGGLVLFATPALAHVTVDPSEARQGSFTKLVFRVPNEVDNANTVKFDVTFDAENHPIASVNIKPMAGWTPTVTKTSLKAPLLDASGVQVTTAVSEIAWSGGTIAPGQFEEFEIFVGPLPAGVDLLLFPAVQTYSDGSKVSWDQQSFAGQPEPEHPAPVLTLTRANAKAPSTTSNDGISTLALAAFLIGSAGLGMGTWAWTIVRRWR